MLKIKSSILLLISIVLFSCAQNYQNNKSQKFSIAYIGGEFDGLLLKNFLTSHLDSFNIYDPSSFLELKTSISHSSNLYITNIDNTSDRENISSTLSIELKNNEENCTIYRDELSISQFYIFASADKILSNQKAVKKIKEDNTKELVKQLIRKLNFLEISCN
tara:strand:+ start:3129 stop:3614 length:486 start_codon:yes stop_codon:yes gene_type:complete